MVIVEGCVQEYEVGYRDMRVLEGEGGRYI
jgi:hypothetical protein